MKRIMIVMLALALVMTGCSQTQPEPEEKVVDINEGKEESTANVDQVTTDDGTEETEESIQEPSEPVEVRVIAPYGTPVLSMVKMMTEQPEIGENVTVTYEALASADVLTTALINQDADIAIVPTNLAAVLHAKEAGYRIAGSSVWGVLYIVAMEEIESLDDLKGKSISMIGQGLTPDAMMRYILTENGIDPDADVTLEYFSGSSELAANFISGQADVAMIPQPLLTMVLSKREGSVVAVDLQEEWGALTGEARYPLSSIIVSEALAENHPEVVESFLGEFEAGVEWLNTNPGDAGAYYEGLDIGLKAPIVEKAIPFSNLTYISAEEGRELFDSYLQVLYEFNPKLTGGAAVDETLYLD